MFDLLLMLSRYVFLFYIVLFLWQGIVYIAYEQGGYLGSPYRAISIQRSLIVLMHVTAFLCVHPVHAELVMVKTVRWVPGTGVMCILDAGN